MSLCLSNERLLFPPNETNEPNEPNEGLLFQPNEPNEPNEELLFPPNELNEPNEPNEELLFPPNEPNEFQLPKIAPIQPNPLVLELFELLYNVLPFLNFPKKDIYSIRYYIKIK
jgi:hypothetical protein